MQMANVIRGGSIIQLFHREMESYIAAEGVFGAHVTEDGIVRKSLMFIALSPSVHLRSRPLTQKKNNLLPPTSSIMSWCIEKEASTLDASPVRWQENIRLQVHCSHAKSFLERISPAHKHSQLLGVQHRERRLLVGRENRQRHGLSFRCRCTC